MKSVSKHIAIAFGVTTASCFLFNYFNASICSISDSTYWLSIQSIPALIANLAVFKLCQHISKNKFLLGLACNILFIVLFTLPTIYDLLLSPQLSFYHILWGYYHGPIYDAYIPKPQSFLIFRLWTSIVSLGILSFFYIKKYNLLKETLKNSFVILLAVLFTVPLLMRNRLGWVHSYNDVKQVLKKYQGLGPVKLYYSDKSYTFEEAKVLLKTLHFEYMFLAKTLRFKTEMLSPVDIYIYPNQYVKKNLIGSGLTLIGNPIQKSIHALPFNPKSSIFRHEIAHIILRPYGFYGLSISPALIEGLATALEYERHGLSVHEWSKAVHKEKLAPPLKTLFSPSGFWSHNGYLSYLYTGSFMHWLLENYPKEKILASYASGNFKKHLSKKLQDLEQEWLEFLSTVTLGPKAEEKALFFLEQQPITKQRCPHQIACQKKTLATCQNIKCAIKIQKNILELSSSGNISTQFNLLKQYLASNQLLQAQKLIERLSFQNLSLNQIKHLDLLHADTLLLLNKPKAAFKLLNGLIKKSSTTSVSLQQLLLNQHAQFRISNALKTSNLKKWLTTYYNKHTFSQLTWDNLNITKMFKLALIYQYKYTEAYVDSLPDLKSKLLRVKPNTAEHQLLLKLKVEIYEHLNNWSKAHATYKILLSNFAKTDGERFYYQHQLKRIKSLQR